MEDKRIIEISLATLLKITLVVLGVIFLYYISDILIVFLLSLILGSTVSIWANYFSRFRIPKVLSILFIYILIFLVLGLFISLIIPPLSEEISNFSAQIPVYYENIYNLISKYTGGIEKLSPDFSGTIANQAERLKSAGSDVFSFLIRIFGGIASFFAVIVISFYLAFEEKGIEKILRILTPLRYEDYILDLWTRTQLKLGRWLSGQIILALIIGSLVFIGLTLIGVPYALLLGIIAAILEIVPFVGPVISAVIGVIVAFSVSLNAALLAAIYYIIVQQIENHIIVPLLMQKMTGLNPVVIIVALMVGFKLGGVLGMIIAVPLAAIFGELVKDLADKKHIDLDIKS